MNLLLWFFLVIRFLSLIFFPFSDHFENRMNRRFRHYFQRILCFCCFRLWKIDDTFLQRNTMSIERKPRLCKYFECIWSSFPTLFVWLVSVLAVSCFACIKYICCYCCSIATVAIALCYDVTHKLLSLCNSAEVWSNQHSQNCKFQFIFRHNIQSITFYLVECWFPVYPVFLPYFSLLLHRSVCTFHCICAHKKTVCTIFGRRKVLKPLTWKWYISIICSCGLKSKLRYVYVFFKSENNSAPHNHKMYKHNFLVCETRVSGRMHYLLK